MGGSQWEMGLNNLVKSFLNAVERCGLKEVLDFVDFYPFRTNYCLNQTNP